MSRRRLLAWIITPAVLAGVIGFFGNRIAEYFKDERSNKAAMTQDELKDLRAFFLELAKSRPKTSSEARQKIEDLRGLIAVFTTEAAKNMGQRLLDELATAAAALNTAEVERAASQSQLELKRVATERNDRTAIASAQKRSDEALANAEFAKGAADFALERAIRLKTR